MPSVKLSFTPKSVNLSVKTIQRALIGIENISNKVFGKSILSFILAQCQKK